MLDAADVPSSWKFAAQFCISRQIGQSRPVQSWSASAARRALEKKIVTNTNAAQIPAMIRCLCALVVTIFFSMFSTGIL